MDTHESKTIKDLMEPGATLMVGSHVSGKLEFRPLTVGRVSGALIEILVDGSDDWVNCTVSGDPAYVTLSDTRQNTWVSLSGNMSTTTDPSIIDELWTSFASVYFDNGRATPGITVLRIECHDGRYWSTASGRIGILVSAIKAALGSPNGSGLHGKLSLGSESRAS